MSQTNPVQQDSLKLSPDQVKNIYRELKEGEAYKLKYLDCVDVANSLNGLIEQSNDDIKKSLEVIEKQKKWYKSPYLWLTIGFLAGAWSSF